MRLLEVRVQEQTEWECFLRRLFGNTLEYAKKKPVRRGDIPYLHNNDTDVLYGPFFAESDAGTSFPTLEVADFSGRLRLAGPWSTSWSK